MARIDPEGNEMRAVRGLVDFSGASVLEIGAGDGRFTWLYADAARSVHAIEPREEHVRAALDSMPPDVRGRVRFEVADATTLRYPRNRFDVAVLSHSL